MYNLDCVTWKPVGTSTEEFAEHYLHITPRLKNENLIHTSDDRELLRTKSSGVIHIELGIITRDLQKFGVISQTDTVFLQGD
jgi:B9 domain-containing protein 2